VTSDVKDNSMASSSDFIPGRCHRVLALAFVGLLVAAALAGCGEGSSASTASVPSSPAAATQAAVSSAVAYVSGTPISKAGYEHWTSVESKLGGSANAPHRALAFLITSQWVLDEAAARKLAVSEAEVKRRFVQLVHQSFPQAGSLQKYYSTSGATEADLLARVKVELLKSHIAAQVTAHKSATQAKALLASFQKAFQAHWKALTTCDPGYVMEDCKQYHGRPEDLVATRTPSAASSAPSGAAVSGASASSSSASSSSGEVPSPPGSMTLSSPAFAPNGAIPARYTCDGTNISPPLEWQHLPAHTQELVLFVIDDSSDAAEGGIRWIVAGIDPSLSGISAGQLPSGAIVGLNGSGKATYGGICPPKGKSATIEFVLWALNKKIPLSGGFIPAVAEHDYSHSELGSATTYATYTRG
jgi:Raf kinase inhibitor-like YbhB/YbcL family protein